MDDELGGAEAVESWEEVVRNIFDNRQQRSPTELLPEQTKNDGRTSTILSVEELQAAKRSWQRYLSKARLTSISFPFVLAFSLCPFVAVR